VFFEGKNGQKRAAQSPGRPNSMACREKKKYFYFPGFFRGRIFLKRCHLPGNANLPIGSFRFSIANRGFGVSKKEA
jgi:hypothetical protein